jgi:magnesium transporter
LASGISSDVDADDSIFAQVKARIPWLLIGIVSGILASVILGTFEEKIQAVTALALFIPIIGGTGGNVGVQSSAIVVQSLANGTLEVKEFSKQLGKEVLIGLLNATIISAVIFVYNLIMLPECFAVTISVAVSLFVVVMFATILGTVVPLSLEKLHINPALATGPFIQISNDLVGLIIYVYVSTFFLHLFS